MLVLQAVCLCNAMLTLLCNAMLRLLCNARFSFDICSLIPTIFECERVDKPTIIHGIQESPFNTCHTRIGLQYMCYVIFSFVESSHSKGCGIQCKSHNEGSCSLWTTHYLYLSVRTLYSHHCTDHQLRRYLLFPIHNVIGLTDNNCVYMQALNHR